MIRAAHIGVLFMTFILWGCSENGAQVGKITESATPARPESAATRSGAIRAPDSDAGRDQIWPRDYKSEEFAGGAFAITDFGSPPPGDAAQVIRALEPLAKSGSSKASFEIFQKITECLDYVRSVQPSDAERPDLAEWKKNSATRCKDLTPDDYASASEWLSLAATQGSLSAQLNYAGNTQAVIGDASDLLRDPDAVKAYKERSFDYLTRAMKHGSIDALIGLGNGYGYGIMLKRDLASSYAYFFAAAKADPRLMNSQEIKYLKDQLTPTQISEATRKGNAIYDECCNHPSR